MYYPEKRDQVTSYIDVYKTKNKYDVSLEKLNLIIVVRGYLQNKEIMGDTWDTTESRRTINYFLEESDKNTSRVNQLDLIGAFLQANIKY